jgi:hypothetical protein
MDVDRNISFAFMSGLTYLVLINDVDGSECKESVS